MFNKSFFQKNSICIILDLCKLYFSHTFNPEYSPESLQNKVQFDLRFYNCRRANENVQMFKVDTFGVFLEVESNRKYVANEISKQKIIKKIRPG